MDKPSALFTYQFPSRYTRRAVAEVNPILSMRHVESIFPSRRRMLAAPGVNSDEPRRRLSRPKRLTADENIVPIAFGWALVEQDAALLTSRLVITVL
jgi:hypothetical protein